MPATHIESRRHIDDLLASGDDPRTLTQPPTAMRVRLAAAGLVAAGILFVLYPAIRPFSDEVSPAGAQAFASTAWLVAHTLALIAFILLGCGLLGLYFRLQGTRAENPGVVGLALSWIGIGLTLPYYGAEIFGLHAVGQAVVERGDVSLMSVVNSIRWEEGIWFILVGLVMLGIAVVVLAVAAWRSGTVARWSALLLAIGFALYIPQYTATQPVRILHGVLVMLGCFALAWGMSRSARTGAAPAG